MTAHRKRTFVLAPLLLMACNGQTSDPQHDDAASFDARIADAIPSVGTDVSGVLGGASYDLRYASVQRAVPGDPRNWLCVADVQLTVAQCNSTDGPDRIMFLGPFVYDQTGKPLWGIAQTGLFRVGASHLSQLARSGTLMVSVDDATTGALRLEMNVQFDEAPATGNVVIGP
jgi:hypothetical protein